MRCAGRRRYRRVLRRVAAAAVVTCFCAVPLPAHEIGTTRVSVAFADDGTYQIEIVTDAAALVEKLEVSSGSSSPAETQADRLENLLRSFDETFRTRVNVAFDGVEVQPTAAYFVTTAIDNPSAASATIRLSGQTPSDAKHFTWTYSWTFASYALTVRRASSESAVTEWLEGNQTSAPIALSVPSPPTDRLGIAWRYLTLGFTHIVPKGLDHVLFVLGIYLLSTRARWVLWQVSAFTVAHSITLGLSMYGILALSPRIVEPLIALSIAYVAVENIFVSELKSWRVALVFAFGLLHGMGFAGVLQELGLPRSEFVTALVTFNLGVEAGQLAVIGAAFLLVGFHWSHRAWYRTRIVVPASALIACMAVYWTIARLQP
jgi:hydrogenase/urease accessory protein HupE